MAGSTKQYSKTLQSRARSESVVLCRTDAAWRADIKTAGIGSTFSHRDRTSSQHSKVVSFVNSSLVAQGLGIREALRNAIDLGIRAVAIESDSKQSLQVQLLVMISMVCFRISVSTLPNLMLFPLILFLGMPMVWLMPWQSKLYACLRWWTLFKFNQIKTLPQKKKKKKLYVLCMLIIDS